MSFTNPVTQSIVAFLQEIGLEIAPAVLNEETFLPGIEVNAGRLLIDETKLLYPGDLLHEAGHLAMLSSTQRAQAGGQLAPVGDEPANETVIEAAAIAWSFAALTWLKLDPTVVFHPYGYRGQAAALLFGYQMGVYPGAPALAAAGLTLLVAEARQQGVPSYPSMLKWLRD